MYLKIEFLLLCLLVLSQKWPTDTPLRENLVFRSSNKMDRMAGLRSKGNTKTFDRKQPVYGVKYGTYVFTHQCKSEKEALSEAKRLQELWTKKNTKYIFQVEKGEKTNNWHLQGYLSLRHRRTYTGLQKKDFLKKTHLEIPLDHAACKLYCSKLETRVYGPYVNGLVIPTKKYKKYTLTARCGRHELKETYIFPHSYSDERVKQKLGLYQVCLEIKLEKQLSDSDDDYQWKKPRCIFEHDCTDSDYADDYKCDLCGWDRKASYQRMISGQLSD